MKRVITLTFYFFIGMLSASAQTVVWGGAGDPNSEFAGGLNDWTTVGITCPLAVFVWEADGKADMGAFAPTNAIASPSVSNGAMVFDSDFYDNGGDGTVLGDGICPSDPDKQVAELISPVMDLTGSGRLSIGFNQYHRNFNSGTFVAWSGDGGNSWSEQIQVNDIPTNGPAVNAAITVALKGATGGPNFRVKFIIEGDYYFWIIDDVRIVLREPNNMQVNENWHAIAPNFRTPKSQVEPFSFLADIENVGGETQTNVNLNITIEEDPSGDVVYSDDNEYGEVPSDSLWENVSFPNFFTPADVKQKYKGIYTITSDQTDSDLSNNTLEFKFEVTDSIFAKDKGTTRDVRPADSNWDVGELHSWTYGNYYYVPLAEDENLVATSCSFGIANAADVEGEQIQLKLYRWYDSDEDGEVAIEDEKELVGLNIYDIVGNESATQPKKQRLYDIGFDTYPKLEDDAHYIMMVEYTPSGADKSLALQASEDFDYGAMVLNSAQLEVPRYAGVLGINDPLIDEPLTTFGFGWDIVPVVRLHINPDPGTATEELSEENLLEISPNPSANLLNLKLDLVEQSEEFRVTILDMSGKTHFRQKYEKVQQGYLQFDISRFASGNYVMFISTEQGSAVRKFAVQR